MIPEIFDYIFGRGNFNEMLNTVDFGGPDVGAFMKAHFHPDRQPVRRLEPRRQRRQRGRRPRR